MIVKYNNINMDLFEVIRIIKISEEICLGQYDIVLFSQIENILSKRKLFPSFYGDNCHMKIFTKK